MVVAIGLALISTSAYGQASPMGWASTNGGTTGGAGGDVVQANTAELFRIYAEFEGTRTILVNGQFDVGTVDVSSDKTIIGYGPDSGIRGSLILDEVDNVIIRNLSLSNTLNDGEGDAITVTGATNVWIDHNHISDSPDGLLDIVREADFVTVSWNKFDYSSDYANFVNTNHRFAMLIGNSDSATEDADNLHVTLHNNHWGDFVRERMPRVRYGDIHVFNDYANSPGNNYVIRAALEAEVLAENNYYENVDDPFEKQQTGLIGGSGNLLISTTGDNATTDTVFTPPYDYFLHDAADVKDLVLGYSGVGRIGDFDGDGEVTGFDFLQWQQGGSPYPLSSSDLDDWDFFYNLSLPAVPSFLTAVPEPSTLLLTALAVLGIVSRRRHHVH